MAKNELKCVDCCYHWRDENDWSNYPSCHWTAKCPDDKAPCEYDESDYCGDDEYGEELEWAMQEQREWEQIEEWYTPSATRGDYSPSNPWDAPGMSISDFI